MNVNQWNDPPENYNDLKIGLIFSNPLESICCLWLFFFNFFSLIVHFLNYYKLRSLPINIAFYTLLLNTILNPQPLNLLYVDRSTEREKNRDYTRLNPDWMRRYTAKEKRVPCTLYSPLSPLLLLVNIMIKVDWYKFDKNSLNKVSLLQYNASLLDCLGGGGKELGWRQLIPHPSFCNKLLHFFVSFSFSFLLFIQ